MANIKPYTDEIANAVYGEEVRSSIINALNKVNDDNNNYQDIKNQIVASKDDVNEAVAEFDAKVASAQDATTALINATSKGNTAKSALDSAITSANTARTNLVSATTSANNAESTLKSATSTAQTATASANDVKKNLDSSISSANSAKSALDTAISNAKTAKSNLDTSTSTGNTAKKNLDTAISNATKIRSDLNAVISSAQSAQSSLSGVIAQASTAQTNLQNATNVFNQLTAENISAKANLDALRSEDFNAQEILSGVTDIRAYLGMIETEDVLGITMDYKNKTCTRIAGAKNLTAGADFDKFSMYGGRKRCNVSDGGTINAYYGDEGYTEDGSNGQVMVYQPKFYYLVCPLEYDRQETGYGYHLRKANYYVSETQRAGFKLHPAFYDKNGNEVDYILMSAYEGCIYDTSANAYLKNDEQVMDASKDKFSSIAGARPASGVSQNLTRPNIEQMAKNRGEGWHSFGIKTASMEQLLMIVEMGMMNLQTAIGQGVVNIPWTTGSDTTSSYAGATGSTASLGNGTGRATETTTYEGGVATKNTADGKTSICYRGVENFWGNIWKFAYGINFYCEVGKPFLGYVCKDFNYAESKRTDNYENIGFALPSENGYVSAMGYSTNYDWLFLPSEVKGNSSLPVGDYYYQNNTWDGYRIARLGGGWSIGSDAGGFCWLLDDGVGNRSRYIGGRLVYVPTVTV